MGVSKARGPQSPQHIMILMKGTSKKAILLGPPTYVTWALGFRLKSSGKPSFIWEFKESSYYRMLAESVLDVVFTAWD